MADEPDNLFLQYLGRFDQKLDRVVDEMLDVKVRLTAVEAGFAAVNRRLDRLEIPDLAHRDTAMGQHRDATAGRYRARLQGEKDLRQ
jgi:hypothetical protein